MKTKYIILIILLLCSRAAIYAQGQNNIWTVGNGLGVDFNGGGPVFYPNSIATWEGCASLCDESGKLLFYSDGIKVRDRTHAIMPNGSSMLGDISTTQGVAIARVQGQDSLYFLFTLTDAATGGDLRYSIVDMRRNGGLGDVDPLRKNTKIKDNLSEKMIIAGRCDKQWLMVHHRDSSIFLAYPLGSTTTIAAPVVSTVGSGNRRNYYIVGEMKASPDMGTLALANYFGGEGVEMYDFDQLTGIVSNFRIMDSSLRGAYGVEFSADGSKLYTSLYGNPVYQYNLLAGSPAAIKASQYSVYGFSSFGLRRGPDNMIYMTTSERPTNFSRIRNPDLSGALCGFQKDFLPASFSNSQYCLGFGNQFVQYRDTIYATTVKNICTDDTIQLSGSGYAKYHWNDGSRDSVKKVYGVAGIFTLYSTSDCEVKVDLFVVNVMPAVQKFTRKDTVLCSPGFVKLNGWTGADSVRWEDGSKEKERIIASGGTYWVASYGKCTITVDTFFVADKPLRKDLILKDTIICFQASLRISAPDTFKTFTWDNGSTQKDTLVETSGKYTVVARNDLNCTALTLITNVSLVKPPPFLIKDTIVCSTDTIVLNAKTEYADATYEWSTGERTPAISVLPPATRFVSVRVGNCTLYDSIQVRYRPLDLNIGQDQTVCAGETVHLQANLSGYKYQWSTGATTQEIEVSESGTYILKAYNDTCSGSGEVKISFVNCSECASIPNAFTPNNDGINDRFKPVLACPVLHYEFSVRNRWGQVMFTTNNPNEGWDGSSKGNTLEGNVYYYMMKIKFDAQDNKEQLYKGDVTLIR
ncbi:MAG TPA: gliding motility-associated C-terminal domain-containing protein [Chitinophagaceae bacterium]|nr:gliding motility-associated C-terminal domain-containing protein [Chitinophagaceae bacterium]